MFHIFLGGRIYNYTYIWFHKFYTLKSRHLTYKTIGLQLWCIIFYSTSQTLKSYHKVSQSVIPHCKAHKINQICKF
jgi:hypothetical protein